MARTEIQLLNLLTRTNIKVVVIWIETQVRQRSVSIWHKTFSSSSRLGYFIDNRLLRLFDSALIPGSPLFPFNFKLHTHILPQSTQWQVIMA